MNCLTADHRLCESFLLASDRVVSDFFRFVVGLVRFFCENIDKYVSDQRV